MQIRRLSALLLTLLLCVGVWGQYNPSNPAEPGAKPWRLTLTSAPSDAGSFSINKVTSRAAGESIKVTAHNNGNYRFVRWETTDGTELSASATYTYVMPDSHATLVARYSYNPGNPSEPVAEEYGTLNLGVTPSGAGSVSPSGKQRYKSGTTVGLNAYTNSNYVFQHWTENEEVVSTSSSFNYTVKAGDYQLTAHYVYSPANPSEPFATSLPHTLTLKSNPEGGCSFNITSGSTYTAGERVNLDAYGNTYYIFKNWTLDGEIVSNSSSFTYTMPDKAVTLVANYDYRYSPSSPAEPGVSTTERYHLYGMQETGVAGRTVNYPVYLENTGAVTGFSVDLAFPEGFMVNTAGAALSNRLTGQTLQVEDLGNNVYRFFIRGTEALQGANGKVLQVPVTIPATETAGTVYAVKLDKGVVFKADGSQSAISVKSGQLKIVLSPDDLPDSPDLTVSDIRAEESAAGPGDVLHLSWKVSNIGNIAAPAGWTERIYLVSSSGKKIGIGSASYDTTSLEVGSSVSRSADIVLGRLLGIAGDTKVSVTVVPSAAVGEIEECQTNNTTTQTGQGIQVSKRLYLTMPTAPLAEEEATTVRCQLSRSGDWTATETYNLSLLAGDSRLTVPATVSIPKDQSSVFFYLTVNNDKTLNDSRDFTIAVSGNDYETVTGSLVIVDDELPGLTVKSSTNTVAEGESFVLTVTLPRPVQEPVTVTVQAEYPKRFSLPQTVTIAEGQTSAQVSVMAVDDDVPSLELSNAFTVSAPGYTSAEAIVLLTDDDIPALSLTLTPDRVSESAGVTAVAGILRRTGKTANKITVKLSDDAGGALYFGNRTIEMAKGVEEVHFNFGPVDNATVDGDRTYTITAAVWVSSCNCSASGESAGHVSAQLEVFDDDGAALSLTAAAGTVKEGGQTTLTITRNTATTSPLTLNLTSDYDDQLTYDHTVVIPAGQKSVSVTVKSKTNSVSGDSHTAVFTVAADGFSSGTCYLMITDQTVADARISSISADKQEVNVGERVTLSVVVSNDGVTELPAGVEVKLYHRGESGSIATLTTLEPIAVGGSLTLQRSVTLPTVVGTHRYYAVVNETHKVNELSYTNNTSAEVSVRAEAPFSVAVTTDKQVYQQGEPIKITGQLTGSGTANTAIDLYLINEGARQVVSVTTDAQGAFTYDWKLYALQSGHFSVGACYPGEGLKTEMYSFDVYGIRRVENSYVKCEVISGETKEGSLLLKNSGNLNLTGVTVELLSVPETCEAKLTIPSIIGGGEEVLLSYSLKGLLPTVENKWEEIKARVNTEEGASLDVTLYFYCRSAQGKLLASMQRIVTTMNRDKGREYSIQVTNIGHGKTGKITLALPDFIKSLAGNNLPSVNQNDTLSIPLSFMPTNDMQLNVPVIGQFGINCENGEGTSVSFSITPVSDETGILVVDVCDEYTYYTKEAPHVNEAEIVISNPVTGAFVTQGKTDESGLFSVELPEGYYKLSVTANKHDSFTENIFVDPGKETRQTVNLSYSAITYDWSVVETEVEDEYKIVTTVTFETEVPKPIVVMNAPEMIPIDSLAVGESVVFYVSITNKGLVNAYDVEFKIPEPTSEYYFTLLDRSEPFLLAPQTTVFMPVRLTKTGAVQASRQMVSRQMVSRRVFPACMANFREHHKELCGRDWKDNEGYINIAVKVCLAGALFNAISNWPVWGWLGGRGNNNLGTPVGPGGGSYGPDSNNYHVTTGNGGLCDPRMAAFANAAIDAGIGLSLSFGGYGALGKAASALYGFATAGAALAGNGSGLSKLGSVVSAVSGCLGRWGSLASAVIGVTSSQLSREMGKNVNRMQKTFTQELEKTGVSWLDSYHERVYPFYEELLLLDKTQMELFGDSIWLYQDVDEVKKLADCLLLLDEDVKSIAAEDILEYKPAGVSEKQFVTFIDRLNNTLTESESSNRINIENYVNDNERIIQLEENAISEGFESNFALFKEAYEKLKKDIEEASSSTSICAKIKLEISQTMTMTRQAFRGTLTVYNGHETTAMTDMKLQLTVSDENGLVATSREFQINAESLDGFTGELNLTSGWSLAADATGTATILFIPTKYAAPTEPKDYSFGGTLSYIDPFTGLEVTRELYPVTLTVKPSPELDLTYFMQRDIYGDDPLTLDVVEPKVPAEFALLINNKGNGDASNVRMLTQQPKIIENEKGLYIDFEIVSSQVNGVEASLSFGKAIPNDFGNIPAHTQAYAQWWMESSLLGHFTEYDIQASHLTSYGNENLSLLGDVSIHELIRSLDLSDGSQKMVGFLVNDITDAHDLPDMLYLSNGETASVGSATLVELSKTSLTTYTLTVQPSAQGWIYGNVSDPTRGMSTIKRIVRQRDGKEIPLRNFWQTDRTLRDGQEWLYEYRIHFADEFQSQSPETYVLTVDPLPGTVLEVETMAGFPEERTVAVEPVEKVTVTFNKQIKPDTFTGEDITFAVQGTKQETSEIGISTTDQKTFTLDLSALNAKNGNGYYTLAVQTAAITDNEGYQGKTGKQAGWIYFQGGLVKLLTSTWPLQAGTVVRRLPAGGQARGMKTEATAGQRSLTADAGSTAEYGSTLTLVATPAAGYEFANWTLNGEVVSTEPELQTTALGDMDVVANFNKKSYQVNIVAEAAGGTVEGMGTGIYEHGSKLQLTATPDEDFALQEWTVNGKKVAADGNALTLTVEGQTDINAVFWQEYYRQTLSMARGWNWISAYLAEPLSIGELPTYVNRVVGQTEEVVSDPQYGLVGNMASLAAGRAYKIETKRAFNQAARGHLYDTASQPVDLHRGWNWVAYPYHEARSIDVVANAENGDYMASQTGFAEFADGTWQGTLSTLVPGEGYLYKSASDKTLTLNFSAVAGVRQHEPIQTIASVPIDGSQVDIHRYPNTMNMTAQVVRDGVVQSSAAYRVYALTASEVRGVSQSVGDRLYLTVHGDEATDVNFIVESVETGETFRTNETVNFKSETVGSRKAPFLFHVGELTKIDATLNGNSDNLKWFDLRGQRRDTKPTKAGVYVRDGRKVVVK